MDTNGLDACPILQILGVFVSTRRARLALVSCLTAAAAAIAGLAANSAANATTPPAYATAALSAPSIALTANETEPPLAIETLNHPHAAKHKQERKIVLKRGDGNIVYAACDGNNDIVIKSRWGSPDSVNYCFNVQAKPGYLTLELGESFGLLTRDFPVSATITTNSQKIVIKAAANDYATFGESHDQAPTAVVDLRVAG
ncbi:hypothetical protein ACFCXK_08755 [Streptomyces sp. NPDC056269]|uniref:hypothetical protein n=1 Tax=Streptomyces sp. NPDC056269 TaxID=3345768 RepID=UPI0035D6B27C